MTHVKNNKYKIDLMPNTITVTSVSNCRFSEFPVFRGYGNSGIYCSSGNSGISVGHAIVQIHILCRGSLRIRAPFRQLSFVVDDDKLTGK